MTTANANALTARWASTLDGDATVLSGAGVYVLLALLAPFAAGPAREELLAVAPAPLALPESPTTRMATAVWSRSEVPLTDEFTAAVPEELRGKLTGDPEVDQPELDAWASAQTEGEIPRMPVTVDTDTLMVLAGALLVRTAWAERFEDGVQRPPGGPWAGRELAGLHRRGRGAEALRALRVVDSTDGPLTLLTVAGDEDVDVVLALGAADSPAAAVLPAAIAGLHSDQSLAVGSGPGVSVRVVEAVDDVPELAVSTVRFRVEAKHDLLAHAPVFGLQAATDASVGHFPGMSPVPLAVSQARQDAVAEFTGTGFKAAAVTGIAMRLAGAFFPQLDHRKEVTSVVFDRPFGFLAVHRPTGLVLVAGWVAEPQPFRA
ncbi:serpin family protein [Dactylosporangium sp. NPDC051541]|uniref:serpin family protein n=1 Tax=Dactylosporangium sp. NPDC051541 TaxID=3363977 RepID=UPI0037B96518